MSQSEVEKTKVTLMIFSTDNKEYRGTSAVEIVRALEKDASSYFRPGRSIRQFVDWSLGRLAEKIPPREMDANARVADEELALSYLCLRDEYGAGRLLRYP